MVIACIDREPLKVVKERVKKEIEFIKENGDLSDSAEQARLESFERFKEKLESLPVCGTKEAEKAIAASSSGSKKRRKKRKLSAWNMYMGDCMRKPDKGGLGHDMATCSSDWKSMSEGEKAEYKKRANEANASG